MPKKKIDKAYILQQLLLHKDQLRAMGAARLGLFGSYARNEQKANSDIDFIIDFQSDKKTYKNILDIGDFLENLYGRKVDLITPQSLKPSFITYINSDIQYVAFVE
jgi:uncharacterized protein